MNDQKILDNAPWGATHVNHKNKYFWFDGDTQFVYKRKTDEWLMTFYHENKLDLVRSLADIARIAELEKELSTIIVGLFSEEELEIRDLEQQAKGSVNGYVSACKWALGSQYDETVAKNRALNYAKALKEKG